MDPDDARIYVDECISPTVAEGLTEAGFDAISAREADLLERSDRRQLVFATDTNRVLVTYNVGDFVRLHEEWQRRGKRHSGIIMVPEKTYRDIGRLLRNLRFTLRESRPENLVNNWCWIRRP